MNSKLVTVGLVSIILFGVGCSASQNLSSGKASAKPSAEVSGSVESLPDLDMKDAPGLADAAAETNASALTPPDADKMFSAINQVSPTELKALFPKAAGQGKPMLIEFRSRFCSDCKRMAPIIEGLLPEYSNVQAAIFDVRSDRDANKAIFNAFRPSIVPILIFVKPDGAIYNVLYGAQEKETIEQTLNIIHKA